MKAGGGEINRWRGSVRLEGQLMHAQQQVAFGLEREQRTEMLVDRLIGRGLANTGATRRMNIGGDG